MQLRVSANEAISASSLLSRCIREPPDSAQEKEKERESWSARTQAPGHIQPARRPRFPAGPLIFGREGVAVQETGWNKDGDGHHRAGFWTRNLIDTACPKYPRLTAPATLIIKFIFIGLPPSISPPPSESSTFRLAISPLRVPCTRMDSSSCTRSFLCLLRPLYRVEFNDLDIQ